MREQLLVGTRALFFSRVEASRIKSKQKGLQMANGKQQEQEQEQEGSHVLDDSTKDVTT